MSACQFDLAWIGPCRKPVLEGATYCPKHEPVKCVSCGKPATRECGQTYQLVCGALLCNDCEDIGNMKHVPKDSEAYKEYRAKWDKIYGKD
jgi:hypothetical protein